MNQKFQFINWDFSTLQGWDIWNIGIGPQKPQDVSSVVLSIREGRPIGDANDEIGIDIVEILHTRQVREKLIGDFESIRDIIGRKINVYAFVESWAREPRFRDTLIGNLCRAKFRNVAHAVSHSDRTRRFPELKEEVRLPEPHNGGGLTSIFDVKANGDSAAASSIKCERAFDGEAFERNPRALRKLELTIHHIPLFLSIMSVDDCGDSNDYGRGSSPEARTLKNRPRLSLGPIFEPWPCHAGAKILNYFYVFLGGVLILFGLLCVGISGSCRNIRCGFILLTCANLFIYASIRVIDHALNLLDSCRNTVSQKYLTPPHFCNTLIAIRRA